MATDSSVAALTALDTGGLSTSVRSILTKSPLITIPWTIEKVAGNTDGDQIQTMRVHKSWALLQYWTGNDALTGYSDVNIGLWSDAAPGVATDVDENVYADALNYASATALTNVAFHTRNIDKMGQQIWQDAGAASYEAAAEYYRIAHNIITGGTAAATISGFAVFGVPNF